MGESCLRYQYTFMIQRLSVPSLVSFWDERLLHSWFDSEKPGASPSLTPNVSSQYRDTAPSDTGRVRNTPGDATSTY